MSHTTHFIVVIMSNHIRKKNPIYTTYILHIYYIYLYIYILHIYYIYTTYILHIYYIYTTYILHIYFTYSIYVFPDMVRHYDDNEMSRVRHIDSLKYVAYSIYHFRFCFIGLHQL